MEDPNNVVRFSDLSSIQITTGDCQVTITPYVTKSFVVFKFFFPDLNGAMDVVVPRDSEVSKGDPVSLLSQSCHWPVYSLYVGALRPGQSSRNQGIGAQANERRGPRA